MPSETSASTGIPAVVTDMALSIEGGSWTIPWDETRGLKVTCKLDGKPADITEVCVCASSDARILAVGKGAVYGKSAGVAVLTAEYGGQKATQSVKVLDANPKNVWFYDRDIQLPLALYGAGGMRYPMILCSDYDNGKTYDATREASWRVENPAVASVDAGAVTALRAGKTTIVARYGKFEAKTALTVFDGPPDRLTVDAGSGEIARGSTLTLTIFLGFGDGGDYPAAECVTVYSRDPNVAEAMYENGAITVRGLRAGDAEIVVSAFGLSRSVVIKVK
jgi:hypothetical protein